MRTVVEVSAGDDERGVEVSRGKRMGANVKGRQQLNFVFLITLTIMINLISLVTVVLSRIVTIKL